MDNPDEIKAREIVDKWYKRCSYPASYLTEEDKKSLINLISDTRKEERERCAKIANEKYLDANAADTMSEHDKGMSTASYEIESAIRQGDTPTPHNGKGE